MTLLTALRRRLRAIVMLCADPFFVVTTISNLRQAVDHDGEAEQHQPQFHQRRQIDVAGRFGEFVGDHCRDRVARARAAKRESPGSLPITMVTAMVSPSARARPRKIEPMIPSRAKGTTHLPGRFPLRRAQRQRRFALLARHRQQRFARDGNDERKSHDGQDHAGGQIADAVDGAAEKRQEARASP